MKKFIFILIFAVLESCNDFNSISQFKNDIPRKNVPDSYSPKIAFEKKLPMIEYLPPVSDSMPDQVKSAYFRLNRVLKYGNKKDFISTPYKTIDISYKRVKEIMKDLYIINNYNPVIAEQYLDEIKIEKYNLRGSNFKFNIGEKFREYYKNYNNFAYYATFYSDMILRVEIVDIDSALVGSSFSAYWSYKATAVVNDIIKGQHFKSLDSIPDDSCNHYFDFKFTALNSDINAVVPGYFYPVYTNIDNAFIVNGDFKMKEGQEAIIFVTLQNHQYDKYFDYYDLMLCIRCSLNALLIEDGIVHDINKFWSDQIFIPYEEWKQLYKKYESNILKMDYE